MAEVLTTAEARRAAPAAAPDLDGGYKAVKALHAAARAQ
jgi:hypothetical protein